MPSYLLDTSVILDLINERNDRRNFIRSLVQPGDTIGCCLINIIEVYTGMRPGEEVITGEYLDRLFYHEPRKSADAPGFCVTSGGARVFDFIG